MKSTIKLTALVAVVAFGCGAFNAHAGNGNDKSKHKIKFKVLQNTSYGDCAYAGEVILDARYKFHKADSGQLNIETSTDGVNYQSLQVEELDGRRGQIPLVLDVGDCTKDIRLSLTAD
jgi:hypothetical protein